MLPCAVVRAVTTTPAVYINLLKSTQVYPISVREQACLVTENLFAELDPKYAHQYWQHPVSAQHRNHLLFMNVQKQQSQRPPQLDQTPGKNTIHNIDVY